MKEFKDYYPAATIFKTKDEVEVYKLVVTIHDGSRTFLTINKAECDIKILELIQEYEFVCFTFTKYITTFGEFKKQLQKLI